jgi:hypothetical protein
MKNRDKDEGLYRYFKTYFKIFFSMMRFDNEILVWVKHINGANHNTGKLLLKKRIIFLGTLLPSPILRFLEHQEAQPLPGWVHSVMEHRLR